MNFNFTDFIAHITDARSTSVTKPQTQSRHSDFETPSRSYGNSGIVA